MKETKRTRIDKSIEIEKKNGFKHISRNIAVLASPNSAIELMQFDGNYEKSKMPVEGPGITHVCFQSPVAKPIYEKAKTFGATIVSRGNAPIDRGFGYQYAYARDENGIMFEMEQAEKPTFTEDIWIGHVAIVTPNIDSLVKFYTLLLAIAPHRRADNIKDNPKLDDIANIDNLKIRGAWIKIGNTNLEMWQFENPLPKKLEKPSPMTQIGYNKISFEVKNLDSVYKKLKSSGIKFLSEPIDSKVLLRDIDGNLLELFETKK